MSSKKIHLPMRGNIRRRIKLDGEIAILQTKDHNPHIPVVLGRKAVAIPTDYTSDPKWEDQATIHDFDHAQLLEEMLFRMGVLTADGKVVAKTFKIKIKNHGVSIGVSDSKG